MARVSEPPFRFVSAAFAVLMLSTLTCSLWNSNRLSISTSHVMMAWALGLYLISHLFKTMRLYLTLGDGRMPLLDVFRMHFVSAALGTFSFVFVQEAVALLIGLESLRNHRILERTPRILIALPYLRIFDALILGTAFLAFSSVQNDRLRFVLGVFLGGIILVLMLIFLGPQLIDRAISYLIKHVNVPLSVPVVRLLASAKRNFEGMKLAKLETVFPVLVISILAWAMEAVALFILLGGSEIVEFQSSVSSIANRVAASMFLVSDTSVNLIQAYGPLYWGLGGVSLLLLVLPHRK